MNTALLTHVRQMFSNELCPRERTRYNMRCWVRSVRMLGDKWLLSPARSIEITKAKK